VQAINQHLRRPDGIYIDGLKADGAQSTVASQHSNSFALAFRVVPEADVQKVGDYVAGFGMRQGPMTAHRLLQGLAAAGRPEMVVERLTNSETDGWANILARGGTFTWEQWNPEGSESYSHPWGAQAAVDVLETLLGIRNGSPGAATIEVTVPRGGINAASGTVKTRRGPVSASWFRLAGYIQLLVDVPVNVQARVTLPLLPGIEFFPIGPGQPRFVGNENGSAIFETGSGQTLFLSVPK
jgi:alpha-L-rhamnosidase